MAIWFNKKNGGHLTVTGICTAGGVPLSGSCYCLQAGSSNLASVFKSLNPTTKR